MTNEEWDQKFQAECGRSIIAEMRESMEKLRATYIKTYEQLVRDLSTPLPAERKAEALAVIRDWVGVEIDPVQLEYLLVKHPLTYGRLLHHGLRGEEDLHGFKEAVGWYYLHKSMFSPRPYGLPTLEELKRAMLREPCNREAAGKKSPTENLSQESFNVDFCGHLQGHLNKTFVQSGFKSNRRIWCDGVMMPLHTDQLSKERVNDTRIIVTKVWIGYGGGQEAFELRIKFGEKALSRYAAGASLNEALPSGKSMDWIDIDEKNHQMEIQLK